MPINHDSEADVEKGNVCPEAVIGERVVKKRKWQALTAKTRVRFP